MQHGVFCSRSQRSLDKALQSKGFLCSEKGKKMAPPVLIYKKKHSQTRKRIFLFPLITHLAEGHPYTSRSSHRCQVDTGPINTTSLAKTTFIFPPARTCQHSQGNANICLLGLHQPAHLPGEPEGTQPLPHIAAGSSTARAQICFLEE